MIREYYIIEMTKSQDYYNSWEKGFIYHRGRSLDKGWLSPSCIRDKQEFLQYMIDVYKGKNNGAQKMWLFKTEKSALKVLQDERMRHILLEAKIHAVYLDLEKEIIFKEGLV